MKSLTQYLATGALIIGSMGEIETRAQDLLNPANPSSPLNLPSIVDNGGYSSEMSEFERRMTYAQMAILGAGILYLLPGILRRGL
jgi:hypothetical protein